VKTIEAHVLDARRLGAPEELQAKLREVRAEAYDDATRVVEACTEEIQTLSFESISREQLTNVLKGIVADMRARSGEMCAGDR
jgi:DNA polymerase/3'-5' exonuclease PolX